MKFNVGDVVVTPDKRKVGDGTLKNGTIWFIIGTEALVLDTEAVIHKVHLNEIYHCQEYNDEQKKERRRGNSEENCEESEEADSDTTETNF